MKIKARNMLYTMEVGVVVGMKGDMPDPVRGQAEGSQVSFESTMAK